MLDAIGIAFASSKYDFAEKALAGLSRFGAGEHVVINSDRRLALRDAVMMNGILVHGLDYDDTYLPGAVHMTASNVPCLLGIGADDEGGRARAPDCARGRPRGRRAYRRRGQRRFPESRLPSDEHLRRDGVLAARGPPDRSRSREARAGARHRAFARGRHDAADAGRHVDEAPASRRGRRIGDYRRRARARAASLGPAAAYEGHFGFYNIFLAELRTKARSVTRDSTGSASTGNSRARR